MTHTTPVGQAAALDEAAAEHDRREALKAERDYPRLLNLLKLARAQLPAGALRTQIDDALLGRTPAEVDGGLVWESYGAGYALLRRVA